MKADIQRLIEQEFGKHPRMQRIEGMKEVLQTLYGVPGVKKVKYIRLHRKGGSTRTIHLHLDPKPKREGIIVKFNSTNGGVRLGVSFDKETDLPGFIQNIEGAFRNHRQIQRVTISESLKQGKEEEMLEEEQLEEEQLEEEFPREISLKKELREPYLFLYEASEAISEDGEYFLIKAPYRLLREKFGKDGPRFFETLKRSGVLAAQDPHLRGPNKTFLLLDLPTLTSRPRGQKIGEREPRVLGTGIINRLGEKLRQEQQEFQEEVRSLIKESIREVTDSLRQELEEDRSQFSQLIEQMKAEEIQQKTEIVTTQPQGVRDLFRLVVNLLTNSIEDVRAYVLAAEVLSQKLPEEERRRFEEIVNQIPSEFLKGT